MTLAAPWLLLEVEADVPGKLLRLAQLRNMHTRDIDLEDSMPTKHSRSTVSG